MLNSLFREKKSENAFPGKRCIENAITGSTIRKCFNTFHVSMFRQSYFCVPPGLGDSSQLKSNVFLNDLDDIR
jgi:hypothetical protein